MYSYLYTHIFGNFFMADLDYNMLANRLLEAIKTALGNNSEAKQTTSAAAPSGNPLEIFNKGTSDFLNLMTRELPQLASGFMNVKNASDAAKNSLEAVASMGGKVAQESYRLIEEYRDLANQANKIGIGQLDYTQLTTEAQKAGYKNGKDYIDQLTKTAGNSLKTIDQSNELSSRKFLEFAKDVQGTPQAQKLKGLAGVSREEIAQIAAIAAGGKTTQLDSKEGREDLIAKTAEMSNNIERLKNVTGLERGQIIASMQEYNKSARGQLELQAVGNDQTRDALQASRLATAGLGQSMQNITSTIIAGGALNKEQRTQLQVSTGGRAGQYMRAARDVRRTAGLAEDDPQKIAAEERMRSEVARANAYQNSKQFAQRALTTQDTNQKAAYERAQAENTQKFGQGAAQRTGLTAEEAQRAQLVGLGDAAISGRTQEGRDRPYGAKGTQNEGARATQALNSVYESAAMNAASASGELSRLNKELGQSPEKINAVREALERGFGKNTNQDESDKRFKEAGNKIVETVAPGQSSESAARLKAAGPGPKREDKREHGTLGEIGQVSEPKDVVAKLHKGETVVTPEQLKNLLSGSASNAISDVMKSATTKQPASGGLDVSKITGGLKEITTTISSVTGGGSTTRSMVENDDAKAAKKELEAVKAQFQNEKNDIRDNPQAKALEARMQEVTANLSARVSAGTKINTATEPGINRTTINDSSTESVESISSKLSAVKNNKLETGLEEAEYATDESKFEEQSNKVGLNDLNEQLIQLNTSIRQLIEHSAETVETASKQVKATKRLSGNRFG